MPPAPRPRGSWSWTRFCCWSFSALSVGLLLAALATLAWQSRGLWSEPGLEFLKSPDWAFRSSRFGAAAMLFGSAAVAVIAVGLAAPLGIGTAVFAVEYLPRRPRLVFKATLELLAGIPSVVYGLLGVLVLRGEVDAGLRALGQQPLSGDSLLTAGLLLALMILPTVASLADDALASVPRSQRQAARALGLTQAETVLSVVLPQARRGLVAAVLLGLGRAVGETIAVFLVVGRQDGQLPNDQRSWFATLIEPGQTLTSKLGGPELHLAYGQPEHWAALMGLGLCLLVAVGALTGLALSLARSSM